MISLHRLRTFLTLAETGSVRATAERLVVSQPAVSSAVTGLARDLEVVLLERQGRGVRLTPAGARLVQYGRRIVALLDEAAAETRAVASAAPPRLRLTAVTTAAEELIPDLLASFAREPERADVDLAVANRATVWDRLAHDEADVALAGRPPDARFRSLAVRPNALVVVVAPQARPPGDDLAAAGWLVREPGSGTRDATLALFEALGIAPALTTIGSNAAIRACVVAGLGVSLLSRDAIHADLAAGRLVEVATPATPLLRDWHLVAPASRAPAAGALRFVAHAVDSGRFRRA